MRTTYLFLARAITVLVVVQAMTIAFAFAGLFTWISDTGGSLDAAALNGLDETPPAYTGGVGLFLHLMTGERIIPTLALALLIVGFFAHVDKGVPIAAVLLLFVVLQVVTGLYGTGAPYLGLWHGFGAFMIFGTAMAAAMRAKVSVPPPVPAP